MRLALSKLGSLCAQFYLIIQNSKQILLFREQEERQKQSLQCQVQVLLYDSHTRCLSVWPTLMSSHLLPNPRSGLLSRHCRGLFSSFPNHSCSFGLSSVLWLECNKHIYSRF